jgi:ketosteroid isomerase-like protein
MAQAREERTVATDLQSPVKPAEPSAAAFVARFAEAWSTCDPERLLELLTDDVVLRQPAMPDTHGKAAAREAFTRLFRAFPDLHAIVHRWGANGDVVFIEFTLAATFGGRELSWPAVDRFQLRDGLAAERVNYFDPRRFFLEILKRPRGWPRLARSGLRPTLS